MVDRVTFIPSSLQQGSPLELPTLCHWLAMGTSSRVVCRRCWGMFGGEGPPHVQFNTSNNFPLYSKIFFCEY